MMSSALLVGSLLVATASSDLTILVAPKDSEIAKRPASPGTLIVSRLFIAFDRASEHLNACKTCLVTIKVAGGEQTGKAQVGQWSFPETIAPGATLRVLGGYDESMEKRAPFSHPSVLITSRPRSGPVVEFTGKKTALAEVYFSGFAIDVAPGNNYDAKSGALLKGSSSSWPIIVFGSMRVERLTIADNTFVNAANGVGGPRITTASATSEVVVRNNFFVNNVHTWGVNGLPRTPVLHRYVVEGNTFFRNFPYNPDPNTSNPGTVEIGSKDSLSRVELRGNLFAHNPGGAIFPQWDEKRGPQLEITNNLFFKNAALFKAQDDGKGAVVGKFNGSAKHGVFSPSELEEEFSWKSSGNVVLDPQIPMGIGDPKDPIDDGDEESDDGVEVVRNADIDAFAPRYTLRLDQLPIPRAQAARAFGASPTRVATP